MQYVEGFMAALRSHMISLVCNYFLCGAVVKALKAFSQTITGEVGNLCTTTQVNYTCVSSSIPPPVLHWLDKPIVPPPNSCHWLSQKLLRQTGQCSESVTVFHSSGSQSTD